MFELKQAITDVPDFPRPGILFRDISPLLREHFDATVRALDALCSDEEWGEIDALAGIESRGFILGAALAIRRGKGFVLVRKQGKLPPPVVDVSACGLPGSSAGGLDRSSSCQELFLAETTPACGHPLLTMRTNA